MSFKGGKREKRNKLGNGEGIHEPTQRLRCMEGFSFTKLGRYEGRETNSHFKSHENQRHMDGQYMGIKPSEKPVIYFSPTHLDFCSRYLKQGIKWEGRQKLA
jgi:hypothetical protein